jgi:glutamyl-tRNA reductase
MTITLADLAARTSLDADPLRRELARELHTILDDRLRPSAGAQGRNVAELRANIESLRRTEADRIRRLHPEIAAADVDAITHSLVNRLFHSASERLRELEDPQLSESVAALFAPEEPR